jgi:CheY-like chemotaxis protein
MRPRPRTILVVDDDVDVRASMVMALELDGHRVFEAGTGMDAMQLLGDHAKRPDLILLDMMMPVMDGWAFRRIQQATPAIAAIPVIVCTAYPLSAETAAALGAAGFLRKPASLEELLKTVERLDSLPPSPQ